MANPTWPATLPQRFEQDSFRASEPNTVLRSSVDSGEDKVRQRFTAGVATVSGDVLLTDPATQVATLRTFYNTTLKGGSLPFDWVDWVDHTTVKTYRFKSPIGWVPSNQAILAALDLEMLP